VLDEGNERLAATLEERRELLADLRAAAPTDTAPVDAAPDTLHDAVEALLSADDEDVLAQVLLEYPALLSDEAQDALWRLSAEARSQGDEELATYAVECRAMLRRVREGLAAG
jgi:ribosomal protein L29